VDPNFHAVTSVAVGRDIALCGERVHGRRIATDPIILTKVNIALQRPTKWISLALVPK
jgi:hypothetical protein